MPRTVIITILTALVLAEPLCAATPPVSDISPAAVHDVQTANGDALYPLSPERQAQLEEYSLLRNIWRFVEPLVSIAILLFFLLSGFATKVRTWAQTARRKFLVVALVVVTLIVADYALSFPFHLFRGFFVERYYGFMNQSFLGWLGDDLLALVLFACLATIPVWFFYQLVEMTRRWWLWFSIGTMPFLVVLVVVAPVLIDPIFNDFEPLADRKLEARIVALAEEAGIEGAAIYRMDASRQSSKVNAYVTGLLGSKRIVLYDTLIDPFDEDEVAFVTAHEMGHYVMHHIWWGLGIAFVMILSALWLISRLIQPVIHRFRHRFGFARLSDVASLPLVMLFVTIISFLIQPVSNAASRHMERQADRYGFRLSGVSAETAASSYEKLSAHNMSDPSPPAWIEFWFYTHPSLEHRIEAAKTQAVSQGRR